MKDLMKVFMMPTIAMAQDMAFVEEASGTVEMLKHIDRIIRYMMDEHTTVSVGQELDCMKAFIHLYRYRLGSFHCVYDVDESLLQKDVTKYELIQKIVDFMECRIMTQQTYSGLTIKIVLDKDNCIRLQIHENADVKNLIN